MTDQMTPTPDPSLQPVSMHDTPHAPHGALPLIAGMLGVFLVLETVVLGYGVTQYLDLRNRQQAAAEKHDEATTKVKDTATKSDQPKAFWSHLVLDGAEHESQEGEDYTWLHGQITADNAADDCTAVYPLVDDSLHLNMGIGSAGLADPEVLAAFSDRVNQVGLTNLGTILDTYDYSLVKVCTGSAEDYVIMLDATGTIATLADFNEAGYWVTYQPVSGVMDGVVSLYFDVFNSDTPVLTTGYGDAGWTWWSYWVPTAYHTMQLAEKCTDGPKTNDDDTLDYETRVIRCDVEYTQ